MKAAAILEAVYRAGGKIADEPSFVRRIVLLNEWWSRDDLSSKPLVPHEAYLQRLNEIRSLILTIETKDHEGAREMATRVEASLPGFEYLAGRDTQPNLRAWLKAYADGLAEAVSGYQDCDHIDNDDWVHRHRKMMWLDALEAEWFQCGLRVNTGPAFERFVQACKPEVGPLRNISKTFARDQIARRRRMSQPDSNSHERTD